MTQDQMLAAINDAVRKTCEARMQTFCQVEEVESREHRSANKLVLYQDLVLILISGQNIHQKIKLFFNTGEISFLVDRIFGDKSAADKKNTRVADLLKEVANLTAGHMKRMLESSNLACEISLPVLLRGYDELFFDRAPFGIQRVDSWELCFEGTSVVLASEVVLSRFEDGMSFEYFEEASSIDFL